MDNVQKYNIWSKLTESVHFLTQFAGAMYMRFCIHPSWNFVLALTAGGLVWLHIRVPGSSLYLSILLYISWKLCVSVW
jgi:hypothetical protein